MAKHDEIDFMIALDAGAESLADSILSPREHPLARLLHDPVVAAAMAADGVRPEALADLLRDMAEKLGFARTHGAPGGRGRAALV
jgi:predicted RNA-binding Zn ribbon-like protein